MNAFTDSISKEQGKVFKVVIASQRVGAKRRPVGSQ
jgi:hypothetical protein